MRSCGSTYFELDFSVVSLTNAMIAFFAGPSFQEGSGSPTASAASPRAPRTAAAADTLIKSLRVISIKLSFSPAVARQCTPWPNVKQGGTVADRRGLVPD